MRSLHFALRHSTLSRALIFGDGMTQRANPSTASLGDGEALGRIADFVAETTLAVAVTDRDLRRVGASPRWLCDFSIVDGRNGPQELDEIPFEARVRWTEQLAKDPLALAALAEVISAPSADGRNRWLRVEAAIWRDETGDIAGLLLSGHDVTDMVEGQARSQAAMASARDRADAANEAKSEFLANMSHEIRTPMNGVIGMNALLLRTALTSEQRKYAEAVRVSADCLLNLINDILDVSKLEAGKVELEQIAFTLAESVEDVVELLSPRAAEKGLEIAAYLDAGARRRFLGDPTRLRQIVLNLLANALKFTERGYVAVDIRSRPAGPGHTHLRIEVQDTGIGLGDEAKSKLFQKFQQADGSVTRKYGGTGLGLSICRQLVELMGGRIDVADRPGGGSTFWVELTVADARQTVAERPAASRSLAGLNILVVDDIDINRRIFAMQLQAEGAVVSEAEDGPSALSAIVGADARGAPFDIVLLDQRMPGMTGGQVAAKIRANSALAQPRLVLATAIGASVGAELAATSGLDAVLVKPVRRGVLLDRLCAFATWDDSETDVAAIARSPGAPLDTSPHAVAAPEGTAAPERAEGDPRAADHGRILLAEDNEINTMLATTILNAAGYEVECVVNGAEAVEAARLRSFDLILMDMQMPVMDGLQATRLIRALAAPANAVPIVAMTANAMRKDQDACVAAGMNDFISKPIDPEAFLGVVARFMGAELWDDGELLEQAVPAQLADIDESKLDSLARILPPERLLKIIDTYLDDSRGRLDHIEILLETMDFPTTAREAHDLKAASGSFGAQRVQALAAQLERACQCCDDAEAPRLVEEIRRASVIAADQVDRWVVQWRQRQGEAA